MLEIEYVYRASSFQFFAYLSIIRIFGLKARNDARITGSNNSSDGKARLFMMCYSTICVSLIIIYSCVS